jgi:hypothetical protein
MGEKRKYIVSDPSIMMGKPVIAGTRITKERIKNAERKELSIVNFFGRDRGMQCIYAKSNYLPSAP